MRDELVVSYFKHEAMVIGTYKETLLRKDVAKLIEAARWHHCQLDLSGKLLPGDYSDLKFEFADMQHIDTRNSTAFDRCEFAHVDLSYAWMFGNSFKGAVMKDVNMDAANISHSDLCGAHFIYVSFNRTNMFSIKRNVDTGFLCCNIKGALHL